MMAEHHGDVTLEVMLQQHYGKPLHEPGEACVSEGALTGHSPEQLPAQR